MNVNYIMTRIPQDQLDGLDTDARLIITVDDEEAIEGVSRFFEITVDGFGTGLYRLTVRGPAEDIAKMPCPQTAGAAFWGEALVWASPRTIAHVVMDVVNNQ